MQNAALLNQSVHMEPSGTLVGTQRCLMYIKVYGMLRCAHQPPHLPVQVVPRVNSVQYPAQQEISRDRQRLLTRLDHYGLTEREVKGDGNCQVRCRGVFFWFALRAQLPPSHKFLKVLERVAWLHAVENQF
jgi:hypothetical protein